jgi:hypothetical protein
MRGLADGTAAPTARVLGGMPGALDGCGTACIRGIGEGADIGAPPIGRGAPAIGGPCACGANGMRGLAIGACTRGVCDGGATLTAAAKLLPKDPMIGRGTPAAAGGPCGRGGAAAAPGAGKGVIVGLISKSKSRQ